MISLKQYVLEARARLGKLPFTFEEFKLFMENSVCNGKYEDSPYWAPVMDKIGSIYGELYGDFFTGWCESWVVWKEKGKTLKEFYEFMEQVPMDRFKRILGAGSEGAVLSFGDDMVIKVYYTEEFTGYAKKLYEWCSKHNSKCLPKVYKMGRNWVVMEKLYTYTDKIRSSLKIFRGKVKGISMEKLAMKEPRELPDMTPEQKEVYDWLVELKHDLKKCGVWADYEYGDLRDCNVGERKNGELVFFDI